MTRAVYLGPGIPLPRETAWSTSLGILRPGKKIHALNRPPAPSQELDINVLVVSWYRGLTWGGGGDLLITDHGFNMDCTSAQVALWEFLV